MSDFIDFKNLFICSFQQPFKEGAIIFKMYFRWETGTEMICPRSQEPVNKGSRIQIPYSSSLSFSHYTKPPQLLSWFIIYTMCSQSYEHVALGISFCEFVRAHVSSVWQRIGKAHSLQVSFIDGNMIVKNTLVLKLSLLRLSRYSMVIKCTGTHWY